MLLLNAGACPKKNNLSAGGPQHVCDASVCMCLVLSPVCVNMLYPAIANAISANVRPSPRVCSPCIIQQTHKNFRT